MTIEDREGQGPIDPNGEGPQKEPAVRAPWPALTLAVSFVALYALQGFVGDDAVVGRFGFSPIELEQGKVTGLATALFVHGGWAHAGLNALAALAFGSPVARLFGRGAGTVAFFVFFMICGVLASLAYAALNWGAPYMLVGASGAVSGYMGAASRMMWEGPGLAPFQSRPVLSMAAAWVAVNLIVAVVGLGGVTGGAPIAWQAHLAGYAAGLFLVGPFARLLRRV